MAQHKLTERDLDAAIRSNVVHAAERFTRTRTGLVIGIAHQPKPAAIGSQAEAIQTALLHRQLDPHDLLTPPRREPVYLDNGLAARVLRALGHFIGAKQ